MSALHPDHRAEAPAATQAKLVRDKIPQIIRATGAEPTIRVADVKEYSDLLRAKLVEEVDEFLDSNDPEELADILQVLLTLAEQLGIGRNELENLRARKELERGGFVDRIVLSRNV